MGKTMNMISAAKYAKAAKQLPAIRGFREAGAGAVTALNQDAPAAEGQHVIFVCSSDRGLCGALHTNMARAAKEIREEKGDNCKYIVIGEKCRISLRSMGEVDHVIASVADVGRTDPTFADCAAIAQVALENEWSSGTILYNFHKSAMTQKSKEFQLPVLLVLKPLQVSLNTIVLMPMLSKTFLNSLWLLLSTDA